MKYFPVFLLLLFGYLHGKAQKIDTTYIGKHEQDCSAKFFFGNTLATLNIQADKTETEYTPNTPVQIGLGFSYKGIGASLAYGFDFLRDSKKGNTKVLNFQYHHYGRHFVLDFYLQKYTGFYIEDKKMHEFFPDMKIDFIGGTFHYVFNGKRFSYRAAFNQNEKQLKSAGSFQLGAGIYYNKINLAGTPLQDSIAPKHDVLAGPVAGYVYTWVIKKRVTITPAISAGINMGLDNARQSFDVYPTLLSRFSVNYNGKTWSIGTSSVFNFLSVFLEKEHSLTASTTSLENRITFTKRFDWNRKSEEEKNNVQIW